MWMLGPVQLAGGMLQHFRSSKLTRKIEAVATDAWSPDLSFWLLPTSVSSFVAVTATARAAPAHPVRIPAPTPPLAFVSAIFLSLFVMLL
jgi:hypothetical protein